MYCPMPVIEQASGEDRERERVEIHIRSGDLSPRVKVISLLVNCTFSRHVRRQKQNRGSQPSIRLVLAFSRPHDWIEKYLMNGRRGKEGDPPSIAKRTYSKRIGFRAIPRTE